MEVLMLVINTIFNPTTILLITLGTLGGVFIGAMPGLNGPIGVALLLPFTFSLDPAIGLLILGGIYMGSSYGGSISAILLNTPGTAEAACTAMEGYPLAQQGKAKETLYYSILSCVIGGSIGVLTLMFLTPILASYALKFGAPEMFLMAIIGLAVVGSLTAGNIAKGLFSAAFGVSLSFIGLDIMNGTERFTFGISELKGGIQLIPVIVGLFAITEMLVQSSSKFGSIVDVPLKKSSIMHVFKSLIRKPLVFKSSIIGTVIGVLPGAGAAVASFISYGEAKRSSKRKELFGKGNIEGVIASESANNAAVGGSIVPLLALGIPGSATAAILYGALTIHGLIPGPKLFISNPDVAYTFITGMLLTVVVMGFIGVIGVPVFSSILKAKLIYIIPIVITFSFIGAFSIRNSLFDVLLAIVFGILGLIFRKADIPTPPIILGLILGPLAEINLRQSLLMANARDANIVEFIMIRPISIVLIVLLIIILYTSLKGIKSVKD